MESLNPLNEADKNILVMKIAKAQVYRETLKDIDKMRDLAQSTGEV